MTNVECPPTRHVNAKRPEWLGPHIGANGLRRHHAPTSRQLMIAIVRTKTSRFLHVIGMNTIEKAQCIAPIDCDRSSEFRLVARGPGVKLGDALMYNSVRWQNAHLARDVTIAVRSHCGRTLREPRPAL
jgi:hypothetical protein